MNIYSSKANQMQYPFILPELPYSKNALVPHFSEETLDFHHGKHHNTYVVNLNKLIESNPELQNLSLESLIHKSVIDHSLAGVFNNAAQIWNHSFFWHCIKPNGGGEPTGALMNKIIEDFGGFNNFKTQFIAAALAQFGSGWAWLVLSNNQLKIVKSTNAGVPFTEGDFPLLTCDVWEHAYYIDYRNRRADYVNMFLDQLANWDFVEENFLNAI